MATIMGGAWCNKELESQQVDIIILGDRMTGKTSILKKIVNSTPSHNQNDELYLYSDTETITAPVPINGQTHWMSVRLTDTLCYTSDSVTSMLFRMKNGVILVWDVTNSESYSNLTKWEEHLKYHYRSESDYPAVVIFANMTDKLAYNDRIYLDCVRKYASRNISVFKTSAETGQGIKKGFAELLQIIGTDLSKKFSRNNHSNDKISSVRELSQHPESKQCC